MINKVKEDINKLADKIERLKNTHFDAAEITHRSQKKYNAHIHHINCQILQICTKLFKADYLPTLVKNLSVSWWDPIEWGRTAKTDF